MDDDAYLRFEDFYRGTEDLVAKRLDVYVPCLRIVNKILERIPGLKVVDLGCGRGEWLQRIREEALLCVGIDLNSTMIQLCRDKQLDVIHDDAITWLQDQSPDSYILQTAFQFAEHLTSSQLEALISAAYITLHDSGLLILEVPSTDNLYVGVRDFYRDPTHIRPVHPETLAYLLRDAGFSEAFCVYINPPYAPPNPGMLDVITAGSSDVFIVALKNPDPHDAEQIKRWCEHASCMRSLDLASIHDRQTLDYRANVCSRLGSAEHSLARISSELVYIHNTFASLDANMQSFSSRLESIANSYDARLNTLYSETHQLRRLVRFLKRAMHRLRLPWSSGSQ